MSLPNGAHRGWKYMYYQENNLTDNTDTPAFEPESIKTSTKIIFNSHKIPDNPFGISGMTAATSHPSFRPHEPSSFRPPSRNHRHGRWKCDKGCCGPTFRNSPSLLTPAPEKSGKSSPPNTGAPSSMQQIPATSK